MAYADEELVRNMNAYKGSLHGTLETGIYIKEELYLFKKERLFAGKMEVMLPETFSDMTMEQAIIKYPREQRPQVIKTNQLTDVNFTFNLLNQSCQKEEIQELNDYLYDVLKKVQLSNVFYEKQVEEIGDITVGWFDFKSNGIDGPMYNFMYCLPVEGKIMQGGFNCALKDIKIWKKVVLMVIHSIKDTAKERSRNLNA